MFALVGSLLPMVFGIVISPIPIMAVAIILLSPQAKSAGIGFAFGWIVGVSAVVAVFCSLSSVAPELPADTGLVRSGIDIVLGVALVGVALRQWRLRPSKNESGSLPSWLAKVASMHWGGALLLGVALSAFNPENLLMAASAGVLIGAEDLDLMSQVGTIVVFSVLSASSIVVPVIGYFTAREFLAPRLQAIRDWLARENTVIMAVLLATIGLVVLGRGFAYL